jgi:hypothetical protein
VGLDDEERRRDRDRQHVLPIDEHRWCLSALATVSWLRHGGVRNPRRHERPLIDGDFWPGTHIEAAAVPGGLFVMIPAKVERRLLTNAT